MTSHRVAADAVLQVRRAAWHLRAGGPRQLRTWLRRRRASDRAAPRGVLRPDGTVTFEPWPLPQRAPRRPDLRVAVVLDEFSRLAFGYEWQQVEVTPHGWRTTLAADPVDLLFVESAWAGNGAAWQYSLTGPSAPRAELVELVAWCRERGVPTVFWNKEDPAHFEDFLDTARLFDVVLTSDVTRVPAYRQALGHDRVDVLPFAAQPAVHNPERRGREHQSRDIAFAGMYFAHRHPERRAQMELLLTAALRAGSRMATGLEIFSRQLGGDARYQFPPPFAARVVGSLSYPQMLTAYRAYKVFLNVNTVVGSPSMCARRIFEIVACGTPVVSTPSAAVGEFFQAEEVAQVGNEADAENVLRALVRSPELRDRTVHRAQRRVWREHTYAHRVDRVLDLAGVEAPRVAARRSVTALVSTARPAHVADVLRTVADQVGVDVELALMTHGFVLPPADLRAQAAELGLGDVVLLSAEAPVPLGECLNRLVAAAGGDLVAKMDDDDVYGPHYLLDAALALDWSGADVVGKQAHYLHVEATGATLLRFREREHRFTDRVMGPTIMAPRTVVRTTPFPALPRGEDTGFLEAAVREGARVYSADRFNFVQIRRRESNGHTWSVSDAELMASGDVHAFGLDRDHMIF